MSQGSFKSSRSASFEIALRDFRNMWSRCSRIFYKVIQFSPSAAMTLQLARVALPMTSCESGRIEGEFPTIHQIKQLKSALECGDSTKAAGVLQLFEELTLFEYHHDSFLNAGCLNNVVATMQLHSRNETVMSYVDRFGLILLMITPSSQKRVEHIGEFSKNRQHEQQASNL